MSRATNAFNLQTGAAPQPDVRPLGVPSRHFAVARPARKPLSFIEREYHLTGIV